MLQNLKRELLLLVQARTGATLRLFVWSGLIALAVPTAFAFLCVALYDWVSLKLGDVNASLIVAGLFALVAAIGVLASMVARRRARARAILERAARPHTLARLLDPKMVGLALQAGRTLGWQRVMPIALLGFLAVQWAREYRGRAGRNSR
jgi:hypothetical protein